MKPHILKFSGLYWCSLPVGDKPSLPAISCACGAGFTPIESYNKWLKSLKYWEKVCDQI